MASNALLMSIVMSSVRLWGGLSLKPSSVFCVSVVSSVVL